MPEMTCDCDYGIKPSTLSAREQIVGTDDPEAERMLRSLGARFAPSHGWYLKPSRVRMFEALWKAEALTMGNRRYRFPDGETRDIYESAKYLRTSLKRKVMV